MARPPVTVHGSGKPTDKSPVKPDTPGGPRRSVLAVHDESDRGRNRVLPDELAVVVFTSTYPSERIRPPRRRADLILVFAVALICCTDSSASPRAIGTGASCSSVGERPAPNDVRVIERTISAMKTLFTISVTSAIDREQGYRAAKAAFNEIRRVENLMTTFNKDSYLSQVNANAGVAPIQVPGELIEVVDEAQHISSLTEGKFDISAETLSDLWQFRAKPPKVPEPAELALRLPLVDYKSIVTDKKNGTIYLGKSGMRIGLGAIAKGYAVDIAAQVLRKHGVKDFIVNGGGDILFSGKKGSHYWTVGIQDPRDRNHRIACFEITKDSSVSTSGNYEKFFFDKGKRYHHIIDPSTGYSAEGTVSVTAVASKAMLSDAWATALFVLGVNKAMKIVEADPELEALIVDDKLRIHLSSGLKQRVTLNSEINQLEPGHQPRKRSGAELFHFF